MQLTELGNAREFYRRYGEELLYVPTFGKWYYWEGRYWQEDNGLEVQKKLYDLHKWVLKAAPEDPDAAKKYYSWAKRCQARSVISNTELLARPLFAMEYGLLDNKPELLNVDNGTLNLETGELLPHNKKDYITRIIPIPYNPEAKAPLWEQFLLDVLVDWPLIDFVQRAVGYSLYGTVEEQALFFLYGTGRNGKSTFTETISKILGPYAQKAPATLLQGGSPIPNDVARLQGKRLAVASELGNKPFDEVLIKDLTGGDKLVARFLHREYFEMDPTAKLWVYGNHKPRIIGQDDGIWRRINLIPFTVQIPESQVDPKLPEKLEEEAEGILAWAVEGFKQWRERGLKPPTIVRNSVKEYRKEEDLLSLFMDDHVLEDENSVERLKDVYQAYERWALTNREKPLSMRKFAKMMEERGFPKKRGTGNKTVFIGLKLV